MSRDDNVPDRFGEFGFGHMDQYFGWWVYEENRFRAAVDRVNSLDLHLHVQEHNAQAAERGKSREAQALYHVDSFGVATVEMRGAMMKFTTSLARGTATTFVRRQVRQATADESVKAIVLVIDSPGGTVAGTDELALDVAAAAAWQPVIARVEDLTASGAYWVASQATHIVANRGAEIGSIGTYAIVHDYSARAAQMGIKTHIVRAGKFKGTAAPGTEITPEQLGEIQRVVDSLNEVFLGTVAAGRKMAVERVRDLADGRLHVATEAKRLGLIDAIGTIDQTYALARKLAKGRGS